MNSAGIAHAVLFRDTTPELFRKTLDVNVLGSFIPARAAVVRMDAHGQGGAIVNLGSVAGNRGSVERTAYGASKGAIKVMTEVMATELAASGIRVNAIAPGPVETPMVREMHDEGIRAVWRRMVPQDRYAAPEEIASAAAFLISDDASYITGHVLNVDGGFTAAGVQRR